MTDKKIEPLIKKNTLKTKPVDIKDTMNFDRRTGLQKKEDKKKNIEVAKERENEGLKKREEHRKTTMKTQKMSLDVLLKLDILDPFLRSAENIEHDGKLSINDKIEVLIDSYLSSRLSARQMEGFKAIYENYVGEWA